MGNCCSCFSKRERSVEDLLDGSLEDKLLGKREEEDVEVTTAEEEAWRQRREQLKDEEDMSMQSLNDEEDGNGDREPETTHAPLVWDLSDRNSVLAAHKAAENLVEEQEDEEAFGSAKEDESDDDQETKEQIARGEEDRLTQLSSRSLDSYASMNDSYRGEDTRVFRDTELDRATEVSDTFLAPSSLRDTTNGSFLVDDDTEVQQEQEQQRKEEQDGDQDDNSTDKRRSNSSRRRSGKKKSRSRKSK
ncbi:hypothetical protein P3T76_005367 [Phytophthora citrophthora]|uniref:Uncharacterized protein n=1 Tax=Phytophthora citrophthora TaxID=4793 RepID=A0AAD9LPT6_9STRA|nr:hypothetical protein P3T76_005367 [Phytophthora citrophthora]